MMIYYIRWNNDGVISLGGPYVDRDDAEAAIAYEEGQNPNISGTLYSWLLTPVIL